MKSFDPQRYWQERLQEEYSLKSVGYLKLGEQYNRWLYKIRRRTFRAEVFRFIKTRLAEFEVLDIGSGTGFYINCWQELGVHRICGVDITTVAVDQLKKSFPSYEFYQSDIGGDLTFLLNRSFDAISAMDILFHILDDDRYNKALSNIFSLLKIGGYFIFTENMLRLDPVRSTHQVSRSRQYVENALIDCGFEILHHNAVFYWMNSPVDSHSKLHHLFWKFIVFLISRGEWMGFLVGAALYPIELLSLGIFMETPSTEIIVCRKPYTASNSQ